MPSTPKISETPTLPKGQGVQNQAVTGSFAQHLEGAIDAAAVERLDQQMESIKHKAGLARGVSLEEQREVSLEKQKEQLWEAALDLEALFLQQLISAMQRTVPREDGVFGQSKAEELFRGMLDEEWANLTAKSGDIGLARNLYDQLVQSLIEGEKAKSSS